MSKKAASITSGLIAKKGAAAPIGTAPASSPATAAPAPAASKPKQDKTSVLERTTAVTTRLEDDRYKPLKLLGTALGKTNQDIMVDALDDYLAKHQHLIGPLMEALNKAK